MDEVLVARGQNAMEWRPTSAGYSGKTARQCWTHQTPGSLQKPPNKFL